MTWSLRLAGSAAAVALVASCAAAATAQRSGDDDAGEFQNLPKLMVRGEAELDKPADRLRLTIGVVTEHAEATTALDENSRRMRDVVRALEKTGLTEGEYETGRFSVRPVYARRPRNAGAEWRPHIVGYAVTNTLNVKTKKLELAGPLIEAANDAGANSIDSIGFDLADPRIHRAEAISAAAANARADAAVLAEASGVRLVRILSVTLDEAGRRPPVPFFTLERAAAAEAAPAPPIQPGDVTVRAGVTIVYEIEQ